MRFFLKKYVILKQFILFLKIYFKSNNGGDANNKLGKTEQYYYLISQGKKTTLEPHDNSKGKKLFQATKHT